MIILFFKILIVGKAHLSHVQNDKIASMKVRGLNGQVGPLARQAVFLVKFTQEKLVTDLAVQSHRILISIVPGFKIQRQTSLAPASLKNLSDAPI